MKEITTGSDFSGVGAFDYAINRVAKNKGFKHKRVYACDWDKFARITYTHNHGQPEYYPEDVYDREIPKESLDVYMTSPPCQAFSIAGKRLGKNDERGILFFNSLEFIKENKPRYFIFENVKGLLSDDGGKTFGEWVRLLGGKSINGLPVLFADEDSVPYHLYWKVINSKDHGVPQNRERVFLIGIRDNKDNVFTFPKDEHLTKRLKHVLEDNVTDRYFLSEKALKHLVMHKEKHDKKGTGFGVDLKDENSIAATLRANGALCPTDNHLKVIQLNKSKECGGKQPYQQNRVYDANGIIPALNAGQKAWGGNIINTEKIRRLTPRECFRLMDFPEDFNFSVVSDSQAYKQAGNSIVVRVLEKILLNLIF